MASQKISTYSSTIGLLVGPNITTSNLTLGESITTGNIQIGNSITTGVVEICNSNVRTTDLTIGGDTSTGHVLIKGSDTVSNLNIDLHKVRIINNNQATAIQDGGLVVLGGGSVSRNLIVGETLLLAGGLQSINPMVNTDSVGICRSSIGLVEIGNVGITGGLVMRSGTGGILMNTASNGFINILGNGSAEVSINSGSTGTITIGESIDAGTINVGTQLFAGVLNLGNEASAINIGTSGPNAIFPNTISIGTSDFAITIDIETNSIVNIGGSSAIVTLLPDTTATTPTAAGVICQGGLAVADNIIAGTTIRSETGFLINTPSIVIQTGSPSATVILNARCGEINTVNLSMNSGNSNSFIVTNSFASAGSHIMVYVLEYGGNGALSVAPLSRAAGSFSIRMTNCGGASLNNTAIIGFQVYN